MKGFFRRISPKRAVTDFAEHWRQPTPHRWQILGVACAATFCLFFLFLPDTERAPPARPELVYISTFAEDRTDAEIIATNCANQELQDAIDARLAERAELRREMYRQLGRATFVDVDEMEAQAEAEREATGAVDEGPTEEELALSVAEYCARATEG
ncbi:hypothetical protein [Aurantiacibacter sediminis]|uniref:Metal-dependent phosphohydrolase 7TM extracellular domain-containing protein n=1 Tax=Aurantiacibacter sediminis TaxID=2793064 RepID=A0ABS0N1F9_9SPHN|nr:hypothetical protein [Aurantiacibacter sediminis]MBH5321800.1 hypothetical protein [Aurantiacibacter sediminis]